MKIDYEEWKSYKDWASKLEAADLREIVLVKDGKELESSKEDIDDWKFTGLSNLWYIRGKFEDQE